MGTRSQIRPGLMNVVVAIGLAAGMVGFAGNAVSAAISLTPSMDIWTTSTFSYAPGGGGPGGGLNNDQLRVGGWGDEYRSLLQFDLASAPQTATSATLRLYNTGPTSDTPVSMFVDRVTSSWDWTTTPITALSPDNERLWWEHRPSYTQIGTTAAPTAGNFFDIDVTSLYNQWQSGTPNFGVQLRPTETSNVWNTFASSENANAAWRPQMIVEPLTPPPLPPGAPQPGRPDTLIGPTSLVSSNGVGAVIDKTKPTILLTHGWQPCAGLAVSNACPENYTPSDSPLSELLAATKSALTNPDGTQKANILTFQWSAAHTDIATLARVFTDNAGAILAEQLQQALGSDYAQPIHLVGHSFGTMVNARAANLLTDAFSGKAFGVEQVTLLDAPFQDKGTVWMSSSEIYDRLPRGTVQYVDNFYGTSLSAFGGPILGAAPGTFLTGGGEAVPNLSHSEIQSVFYKSRVSDLNGLWITSTMGDRYQNRPEPETWSPPPTPFEVVGTLTTEFATAAWRSVVNAGQEVKEYAFEIAGKTYNVVVDAANTVIKKSSEIVVSAFETIGDTATAIIDAGQGFVSTVGNKVMSWIRLRESSPVMIARDVVIPDGAESLRFDLDFLSHGDGDWLTVYFEDQLLWSFRGSDLTDDILAASIPLPELAGKEGTLYFTLNSIGDANADFLIGNLAFTSRATVPEPSTLSLLCLSIGWIWILWFRQQIANGGR